MTIRRAVALGTGSYLPETVLTNADLALRMETSDEWIQTRTGIRQRHIAAEGQFTSDLALQAARRALDMAGLKPNDLDMIVLATATPDNTFPATAAKVQRALGMTRGFAFDVQAVCAGFVYAMTVANTFILTGQAKTALVIGAETFSRILDWEDRATCVLFGDGAGALVLQAQEGEGASTDRGFLRSILHTNGAYHDILYVDGGPSTTGAAGCLRMRGKEVFRHAVQKLAEAAEKVLENEGLTGDDVDWFVPHQANFRIIESTARKSGVPLERVVQTVATHGNTSAASIPLALDTAVRDGRIKPGHLLLFEAIGGGLSWGAALLRW